MSGNNITDYRDRMEKTSVIVFQTVNQYYLFDVQKDEVRKISKDLFDYIRKPQKGISRSAAKEWEDLEGDGYLQSNQIKEIKCCIGDYDRGMQKGISVLILQVTQMCNLKCEYCPHAQDGNPYMRTHRNEHMSKELAFRAIDYLADHSKERKSIDISFFGGEPLIKFDLIKETVFYAEEKLRDKTITFNISTNAVLLTDEIIDFFSKHRFCICVSMDGPEKIHDKNRKDWSGRGSFTKVYENFSRLKKAVENTQSKIIINAVLDLQCDIDEAECFFREIESEKVTVFPCLVDDLSSTDWHIMTDDFYWKSTYFKFLLMLSILEKIDKKDLPVTSKVFKSGIYEFEMIYNAFCNRKHTVYPVMNYQIGDFERSFRLYVNCQGNFYPTVGVNENKEDMVIGNIEEGMCKEKMLHLLQTASFYKEECKMCPAVSYCRLGVSCFVEEKGLTEHIKQGYCKVFLQLFHEAVGLILLKEEREVYYQKPDPVSMSVEERDNVIHSVQQISMGIMSKSLDCSERCVKIPLLSREIGMSALELVYVLFELEKKYGITFGTEDVMNYGFCSVQNIADLILMKRCKKDECGRT